MSSGCGDVLSLEDLKTAKKHQLFEAEVITGRVGGVPSGEEIDYATNQVTGQTQKTMPAILRDIGFSPAPFDFDSGGTLTTSMRDYAVLWPAPGGNGEWYYWEGALPKVIPAASTPASTGGIIDGAWRPLGDITLRGELASAGGADIIGKSGGGTVQDGLDDISSQFIALSGPAGMSKVGRCATVSALRTIEPTVDGSLVSVVSHTSSGIGGGFFRYVASDSTTPDDNGWCIVTTGGKRYHRVPANPGDVNLGDFGLLPSGIIDTPLTNAWAACVRTGATRIKIPTNTPTTGYTLNGGLVFQYPVAGVVISGDSDTYQGVTINHTGNNTGLTFQKSPEANLFSRVRIEFLRVLGNGGSSANFAEFQDSWRCGATSCWGSLYTLGAMFVLHNRTVWTENAYFSDILSRSNKYGIMVKRTASSGGTDSFYGLQIQMHHQFAVANSSGFAMPSLPDAVNKCRVYGTSSIEVGGWYEAAGGHQAILIGDYQEWEESPAIVRTDGTGGITNGTDMRAVNVSGANSRCDIYLKCLFMQGLYTDVSTLGSGTTLNGFAQALNVTAGLNLTTFGRNIARARGARYKWQISTTDDKSFVVASLPGYSTYRATLTVKAVNMEVSHTYIINTHGANNLAEVTPINTFSGSGWGNFKLKPFNGGTGGGSSVGNGNKISWDHLASTFGVTSAATLEIEML